MRTVQTPLDQHFAQIMDAAEQLLRAAMVPGGTLQDVTDVVRGDRANVGQLRPPLLWLMEGVDQIEPSGGSGNYHNLEVVVAALIADNDPEAGRKAAANLAARAYGVMLKDRSWSGTLHQAIPRRFEPAQRMDGAKNTFWAAAIFSAQVRRLD